MLCGGGGNEEDVVLKDLVKYVHEVKMIKGNWQVRKGLFDSSIDIQDHIDTCRSCKALQHQFFCCQAFVIRAKFSHCLKIRQGRPEKTLHYNLFFP